MPGHNVDGVVAVAPLHIDVRDAPQTPAGPSSSENHPFPRGVLGAPRLKFLSPNPHARCR